MSQYNTNKEEQDTNYNEKDGYSSVGDIPLYDSYEKSVVDERPQRAGQLRLTDLSIGGIYSVARDDTDHAEVFIFLGFFFRKQSDTDKPDLWFKALEASVVGHDTIILEMSAADRCLVPYDWGSGPKVWNAVSYIRKATKEEAEGLVAIINKQTKDKQEAEDIAKMQAQMPTMYKKEEPSDETFCGNCRWYKGTGLLSGVCMGNIPNINTTKRSHSCSKFIANTQITM